MKTLLVLFISVILIGPATGARAQDAAWVQIESVRTLAEGEARARAYAAVFPNVAGFRVGSGWYSIALGPYTPRAAQAELVLLKRRGLIPSDSYLTETAQYGQQFWPVGSNARISLPQESTAALPGDAPATAVPSEPVYVPDETPRQARAAERSMDPETRRQIQEALQWDGVYAGAIDGQFGPATRRAMAAWQAAQRYPETGVLTSNQRAELVEGYRAAFAGLDLGPVRDEAAGIEIIMPRGKVAFTRTEAPFVHYDSTDEDGVRVILISQTGNEATLFGLYDIMQTLEVVPQDGFRERKNRSFVLTGQSRTLNSHTYAQLTDETVKGFTLVWKPGNDKVMQRVVRQMQESFTPLPGAVLPDNALTGDGGEQRIDLLAGLELRRPERSRSGFFVDRAGSVLTTTDALDQCGRITIGEETDAEVTARDDALGLALLRPLETLAPLAVAEFRVSVPRLNSEVTLAGFSYEDVLDLPVLTFGTLADIRGLQGEDFVQRLSLASLPGDAGGPIFDASGAVLGMLRPRDDSSARRLPPDVNFAIDVPAIVAFLGSAGLSPRPAESADTIAPEDLTTLAGDVTVRVSCWN